MSSSSLDMDAFLIRLQKTPRPPAHPTALFAPGTITCVYGQVGCGKTYMVEHALPRHISVDHNILKSRQMTLDFFERLACTNSPVIIDDWESVSELIGIREITGPVSRGPLVIIAYTPIKLTPDTILYDMPVMTPDKLLALAPPGIHDARTKALADSCQGDVRAFLQGLVHVSDSRDAFKTSREIVIDLVTCPSPVIYLTATVHEHGYVWNMIQENYVDAKGITLEKCYEIAESMSLADVYDTKIYADGAWDTLMPYFILSGCVAPCHLMNQKLSVAKMRTGSLWTKFQNGCMRAKKIKETRLDTDRLRTIRVYVEHGQYEMLDDYKMDAASIDVMNHIVIGQKLKPKLVEQAKKHVRARDGGAR